MEDCISNVWLRVAIDCVHDDLAGELRHPISTIMNKSFKEYPRMLPLPKNKGAPLGFFQYPQFLEATIAHERGRKRLQHRHLISN